MTRSCRASPYESVRQDEVAREMGRLGFRRRTYNPCLYYHGECNLCTFLHGGDFATVGTRDGVWWFTNALEKWFEIKSQYLGFGALGLYGIKVACSELGPATTVTTGGNEGTECRLLNRVIRCTWDGFEVEPDQWHVDLIAK